MQNNKIPEIRFKGFTEDWEQRKLWENELPEITKNLGCQSPLTIAPQYG